MTKISFLRQKPWKAIPNTVLLSEAHRNVLCSGMKQTNPAANYTSLFNIGIFFIMDTNITPAANVDSVYKAAIRKSFAYIYTINFMA